jgi:hypothetical protein
MENVMLKLLSICAALVVFATWPANAQQQEAVLQRIEVPGAAFDLVLATPGTPTVIFDFSESPDALVIYLAGGMLALGFERADDMMKVYDTLNSPVGVFHIRDYASNMRIPITVYKIAKGGELAIGRK